MNLQDLQEQLRAHIRARISRGELTGSALAQEAGFPQGHLSNFLNARRGLSLESMDRLLATLEIGILDLVKREEIRRQAALPEAQDGFERVALVSEENAALARFAPSQILATRSFHKSFLRKLRVHYVEDRRDWLRFVLIRLDVRHSPRMFLRSASAAILLIDRHYSSLEPYRRLQPNIYAVRLAERCSLGHLTLFENCLVMSPQDPDQAVKVLRIERGRKYSEYIIGRVCYVGLEL